MAVENGASVAFSASTKDEETHDVTLPYASVEEGIPAPEQSTPPANGSNESLQYRQRCLSAVSKKYDIDGDGMLNEAEQAMRDMDKSNRGYLSNDKVYEMLQEQLRMQKRLELAKRLLIFFAILLVILALANIGVAFAAAALAKDTSTDSNNGGILVVKGTDQVVSTNNHANVYGIATTVDVERRLDFMGNGTTDVLSVTTIPASEARSMYNDCAVQGSTVTLRRTWDGFPNVEDFITLCPGNGYTGSPQGSTPVFYDFTLSNNRIVYFDCDDTTCTVTGSGLKQNAGEKCVTMVDCLDGSWCMNADSTTGTPGTCQLSSGVPGCLANIDCITDYCHPSQAYGAVGTCTCNPTTAEGCRPGKTCFTADEVTATLGITGFGPTCFVPDGGACSSSEECLSQSCVSDVCQTGNEL